MEILDALNDAIETSGKGSNLRRMAGVHESEDFKRIYNLPRKQYSENIIKTIQKELSKVLSRNDKTLLAIQAVALFELSKMNGLLGPIPVGGGKTLISLLAPIVTGAKRPLVLMPASLIEKTKKERDEYAKDFYVPYHIHFQSYESLGRVSNDTYLTDLKPDLIVADEAHKVKNPKAAVTRRLKRYMKANPETVFAPLSGTIVNRSLLDVAHLSHWALDEKSPLPIKVSDLLDWAACVDHFTNRQRPKPGALTYFSNGSNRIEDVRKGVRDRIVESPGVVSFAGDTADCSLQINRVTFPAPKEIQSAIKNLRDTWETPDEWPLMCALDIMRHASELALGFFYRWNPRPPDDWLRARKAWASFVREVISRSRTLDSPHAVALACTQGKLDDTIYNEWRLIRDTFVPNQEAVWVSDYAIKECVKWINKHESGIVFTSHVEFGEVLSRVSGRPYYGRQGKTKEGEYIEDGDGVVIASSQSNREGRNLQKWNRALVVNPDSTGKTWEQLMGRLHRTGQQADEVIFDVFSLCSEHERAWNEAKSKADMIERTIGNKQKLNYADVVWNPEDRDQGSEMWKGDEK